MALTEQELNEHLGRPKTFRPVQVQGRLPWTPRYSDGRVQVVLAHPLIADWFVQLCHDAADVSGWVPRRIDSYNPRAIRGYNLPSGWQLGDKGTSRHGWAVAWDFFSTWADVPPPGGVWTPDNAVPADFAKPFVQAGFVWGRHWRRRDDPHIELGVAPPAGPNFDPDFLSKMLKQGDVGNEVRRLQFSLRAIGKDVVPNGIFDSATHGHVIAVQTAGKTTVDGLVGPKTEAVIMSMIVNTYGARIPEMIQAAYADTVGRPPGPEGLNHYSTAVQAGDLTVPALWRELWDSEEAITFRAGLSVAPLRKRIVSLEAALSEADDTIGSYRQKLSTVRSQSVELIGTAQSIVDIAGE